MHPLLLLAPSWPWSPPPPPPPPPPATFDALLPAILTLLALYAVWVALTAHKQYSASHWGSPLLLAAIDGFCRFCGDLAGLTLSLEFDHDGVAKSHPDPRVDRQRTHLFVASPHGAFPLAQIGLGLYRFRRAPELLDGFLIAGASVLFWVPLLREFMLFGGVRSPAKADLLRFLRGGTSVGVNPGGNYEMTMSDHAQEQVFAQKKLGFVRLALETGTPLLPMYGFGENQVFTCYPKPLQAWRLWLVRRWRLGAPLFTGRFGLPFVPLPAARRHHVTVVVGRPVEVGPARASPTDAEIDAVFKRYCDELARLFEAHAARLLPPAVAARGLRIERVGHGLQRHVSQVRRRQSFTDLGLGSLLKLTGSL